MSLMILCWCFNYCIFFFAGLWLPFSHNIRRSFSSTFLTSVIVCKSDKRMHFERVWLFSLFSVSFIDIFNYLGYICYKYMHFNDIALLYHNLVACTFFLKLFKIIYECKCKTPFLEHLGIVRLSSKDDFFR